MIHYELVVVEISGGGYRGRGRWEVRFNLDAAGVRFGRANSPDFLLGVSVEPIFHFRKNPLTWDPYLIVLETGFVHFFRISEPGVSTVIPGFGLQVHLNDRLSIYSALKMRFGILFDGESGFMDIEFPIGVSYRF